MTSIRVYSYATAGLWKVSKSRLRGITWVYRGKCSSKGLR